MEKQKHEQIILNSLKKKTLWVRIKEQKFLLMMVLPGLIWYLVFQYCTYAGLFMAFTNYGFSNTVKFVGWKQFIRLFSSALFWRAFRNTIIISLMNIILYFPIPLIVALMINELRSLRTKRMIQFLIYIPYFFSWVVVGSIFITLLSPNGGAINQILEALGYDAIYFMADAKWFRWVLLLSYVWKQMGYGAVVYVATLSTVDTQLYEAARIDGAGHWAMLWHITLPSIKATIVTMLLLNLSSVLLVFEQIMVMQNPSVYPVSDVLQTYSYREGVLSGNLGYATAMSIFVGVVSLILVLGTNKLSGMILDDTIL